MTGRMERALAPAGRLGGTSGSNPLRADHCSALEMGRRGRFDGLSSCTYGWSTWPRILPAK